MEYPLTAHSTDGRRSESITIYADDTTDATMQAIGFVLDEARRSDIWANGKIVLSSPEGNTIHVMEAKE